ncbi:Ger(x)C family spore germination protein [Caldibacillus lycopersici]|uniref:Ger(X)C family spore germination protein n=1 Tax=Perspicuibacillus lycopersici TaxID=1325689 RepID=A0AAE3LRA0_9BACI|nr:Ger(x)C family spore germination protein [Perspicuibacillus lycopersici]MCU9614394.1 Ger(x)C family spore germination protein [Perspicuibacillus lycopersici]
MKNCIHFFMLFLLILLLSGCWNRREVNDLAIAVALGIDKNKDETYSVSVQILSPGEVASPQTGGGVGYETPVTTYTGNGRIIFEALRKLTQQLPNKIYLAHIRMIVIGESVAKEGIYKPLDFLSRDPEMRTDFYIIVSKGNSAKEILNVLTSHEKIPANKLFDSLESSSEAWAATGKVKLNDLIDDLISEGTQPILTAVKIVGDADAGKNTDNVLTTDPKASLSYDGMAAFSNNKLAGWLNTAESKGLNYIKGKVKNTIIVIEVNKEMAGIELVDAKTEIIPHFRNGEPSIDVKITGEANIADSNSQFDFMNEQVLLELEQKTSDDIKGKVSQALDKAQHDLKADVFGFGEQLHKADPKNWDKIKANWTDIFPNLPVNTTVNIKIRRAGTITDPFHNDLPKE